MKRIRKGMAFFLCLVMLVCTVTVSEAAGTLKITDRTRTYQIDVGDTFTYTFWLNLSQDTVNYASDALDDIAPEAAVYAKALKSAKVKRINGYIHYDSAKVELVSISQPNSSGLLTKHLETSRLATGTTFDGSVLDVSRDGIFFNCEQKTSSEQSVFTGKTKILIQVTFKAKSSGACDIRTKMNRIKLQAELNGSEKEFDLVEYGKIYFPYKSYETINSEKPTTCLKSLVGDMGFDVRCINSAKDKEDGKYTHVSKGTSVTMLGVSEEVNKVRLTQKVQSDGVVWFYDVPYGLYYVSGSWMNSSTGTLYQTRDIKHAETVAVPATGTVQALWFFAGTAADLETPELVSVTNTAAGIQIKWKSVKDAKRYCVFRKTGSGSYTKIGTTTSTSYTNKSAKVGKTYTYTVCCIDKNGDNYTSSYDKTGLTIKRLEPVTVKVAESEGSVKVSWTKSEGAAGYYVYRKLKSDSSWTKLAAVKGDLTYQDKTAKNGKTYLYSVRAYSGKYLSARSDSVTRVHLTRPEISKAVSSSAGAIKVTWSENTKADGYQLRYRKDETWTKKTLSGSDNTACSVKNLTKGVEYEVSVRSYKTVNGVKYYSQWSKTSFVTVRKK